MKRRWEEQLGQGPSSGCSLVLFPWIFLDLAGVVGGFSHICCSCRTCRTCRSSPPLPHLSQFAALCRSCPGLVWEMSGKWVGWDDFICCGMSLFALGRVYLLWISPLSHSLKQQNRRRHCGVQRFRAACHRDDDTLVHETRRFR